MRTLGVEPHQVIKQFVVEQINVCKQQIFVVGRKLVLQTPVKTFDVDIHFGGLEIGQPTTYPVLRYVHIKRGFELPSLTSNTRSIGP